MRSLFAAWTVVVVFGSTPAAPVPKAIKKSTDQKVLGRWRLTESQANNIPQQNQYAFIILFQADGVMELRYEWANNIREPITYRGTYKLVDGDKIDYSINDNNYQKAEVLVIDRLTDEEIEWTDPDQKKEKYVREKE
jgi:uncharacterized protein (TIGR03066 family)